jgi:membrane-bound metal-dependent hydrolase YbcI (DUF457 family)
MILLPLLICILGVLFYRFTKDNEMKAVYLWMFAMGLVVTLLDVPQFVVFFTHR